EVDAGGDCGLRVHLDHVAGPEVRGDADPAVLHVGKNCGVVDLDEPCCVCYCRAGPYGKACPHDIDGMGAPWGVTLGHHEVTVREHVDDVPRVNGRGGRRGG